MNCPLVFRRTSAGVPPYFRRWWVEMRFEKLVSSDIPSDFRRASAGIPPLIDRNTKPTTYPLDR
jgi:hypothetical protein